MSEKNFLPALNEIDTENIVSSITTSLGFPRTVLASSDDIDTVWANLKSEISKIRIEYRHEMLARMVVGIRVGLFSSSVNEMWNTTILVLKEKIREFGLVEANQFLTINLDEKNLKNSKTKNY